MATLIEAIPQPAEDPENLALGSAIFERFAEIGGWEPELPERSEPVRSPDFA